MNEGPSDVNKPGNDGSSDVFENSDNQLMEILRNKKKPTPRVTIDRKLEEKKPQILDDIADLGRQVPA